MSESAASTCPTCGHPWARHTNGGMCSGEPPEGSECYCVLFPPDRSENPSLHMGARRANRAAEARSAACPLEPYQVDALAEFVSGPRRLDQAVRQRSPYCNLIRRNLLGKVGGHGESTYALTEAGRAAIREQVAYVQTWTVRA